MLITKFSILSRFYDWEKSADFSLFKLIPYSYLISVTLFVIDINSFYELLDITKSSVYAVRSPSAMAFLKFFLDV